jgi:hypothetical protein
VDVLATLDTNCPADRVLTWVRELDRYPAWLSIVPRAAAEPVPPDAATAEAIGHPAWSVELRATLGPLARSKRLRMVRTLDDPDHVRFERWELDGKEHSPWVLDARIETTTTGSRLTMMLHYGGTFGVGLLEKLLTDEIEASKPRLRALLEPGGEDVEG